MAEDRTLLPDRFSGAPKEKTAEFWRRLETYLEYKRSDNGDKLRLATAVLVLTARDWLQNLPEERKDTFAHLKAAFAEKFIQPARVLKCYYRVQKYALPYQLYPNILRISAL